MGSVQCMFLIKEFLDMHRVCRLGHVTCYSHLIEQKMKKKMLLVYANSHITLSYNARAELVLKI